MSPVQCWEIFPCYLIWSTQQAYVGDAIPFASKAKLLLGHWTSESWHDWTKRVLRFSGRPGTDSRLPTCLLEWDRPLTLSFISLSFNGLIHKMGVITSSTQNSCEDSTYVWYVYLNNLSLLYFLQPRLFLEYFSSVFSFMLKEVWNGPL